MQSVSVVPALWEQPQARRLPAPLPYFYWLVPPCQGSFDLVSASQWHPINPPPPHTHSSYTQHKFTCMCALNLITVP